MYTLLIYGIIFLLCIICAMIYQVIIKSYMGKEELLLNDKIKIKISRVLFSGISIGILVWINSIRYGIGTDYFNYEVIFQYIRGGLEYGSTGYQLLSVEPLFFLINKFSAVLFQNYYGLLIIVSLFIYLCFIIPIISPNSAKIGSQPLMMLIMIVLFFAPSMNIMRQMLAVALIFSATKYIFSREILKYTIVVVLATMLHSSAVLCWSFYFLYYEGRNQKKYFSLLCLSIVVVPLLINPIYDFLSNFSIFEKYYEVYNFLETPDFNRMFIKILTKLPIIFLIVYTLKNRNKYSTREKYYILLFFLEIMFIVLSMYSKWAFRLTYYCMVSEIFLIPSQLNRLKGVERFIFSLLIPTYYLVLFIFNVFYLQNDGIVPFVTNFL